MKLRCMIKTEKGWQKETPEDVSKWMWKHDGEECVVIDEAIPSARVYYCGLPSMISSYREAWEKERRAGDRRRATAFIDLDRKLFKQEEV